MKNKRVVGIAVFVVLTAALLAYFILTGDGSKRYSWVPTYKASSDEPYGTQYLKELLKDYHHGGRFEFNDKKPIHEALQNFGKGNRKNDYVFVGEDLFFGDQDVDSLLSFINKGNDALIISQSPPKELLTKIYSDTCSDGLKFYNRRTDTMTVNFYHKSLKIKNGFRYIMPKDHRYSFVWSTLSQRNICDNEGLMTPLGFRQESNEPSVQDTSSINFFKIKYGKGFFYFHLDPIVFTNYFLIQKKQLPYVEGVLSHLEGNNIIWDEYSKLPGVRQHQTSPLYYILQQPALKFAWWILLVTVILYAIFGAKRRQRVIPVLEAKNNTTLEFVHLVASLHFQNGNPLDMARKKMRYFLYFIKSKYGIQAQPFQKEHINMLAEKSKVPVADVKIIFDHYGSLEGNFYEGTQADKLLNLFYAIENFTTKCK